MQITHSFACNIQVVKSFARHLRLVSHRQGEFVVQGADPRFETLRKGLDFCIPQPAAMPAIRALANDPDPRVDSRAAPQRHAPASEASSGKRVLKKAIGSKAPGASSRSRSPIGGAAGSPASDMAAGGGERTGTAAPRLLRGGILSARHRASWSLLQLCEISWSLRQLSRLGRWEGKEGIRGVVRRLFFFLLYPLKDRRRRKKKVLKGSTLLQLPKSEAGCVPSFLLQSQTVVQPPSLQREWVIFRFTQKILKKIIFDFF